MQSSNAYVFSFSVEGMAEQLFSVVSFKGREYVSKPYRFEIVLASDDPNLLAEDFVYKECRLRITRHDSERVFSGIITLFRHVRRAGGKVIYHMVLMPHLHLLTQNTRSCVFLNQRLPDIIEGILKDADILYENRLPSTQVFPAREYTCQFDETDFAFISRWLETLGIAYFFEERDGTGPEVLVLANAVEAQQPCRQEDAPMVYAQPSGLDHIRREDVVQGFVSERGCIPKNVFFKDYDYQGQPAQPTSYAETDSTTARGGVWRYGNSLLPEQYGTGPDDILAQQLETRETLYQGRSFCFELRTGCTIALEGHYREQYNSDFYLYHIVHEGSDKQSALNGHAHGPGNPDGPERQMYANTFNAVAADCPYRPRKQTPVPQYAGLLTAFIDSGDESEGKYAEIDDQGCYKVRLPFDLWSSQKMAAKPEEKGKVSHWIRLAEPFAGNAAGGKAFGMHFPLLKGTEVLISFVECDIDRPVIVNALYNKVNQNPVTNANRYMNTIRTNTGNRIEMNDTKGKESVSLACPGDKSMVVCNPEGVTIVTDNKAITTSWGASFSASFSTSMSFSAGSEFSAFAGTKSSLTLAFSSDVSVSEAISINVGHKIEFGGDKNLINTDFEGAAEDNITLKGGMSKVLGQYYKSIKNYMKWAAVGAVATGVGSWTGMAGIQGEADGAHSDINDQAALVTGSLISYFGLTSQIAGTLLAVDTYNQVKKKKDDVLYTANMVLGHQGAKLSICRPAGFIDNAKCVFEIQDTAKTKKTFIEMGKQAKDIQLSNQDNATILMDEGKTINIAVKDDGSNVTAGLYLNKGKATLRVSKTGMLDMKNKKISLARTDGGKLAIDGNGVAVSADKAGANTLKVTPNGIQMKFTGMGKMEGAGTLKLNPQGMLMLC